MKHTIDAKYNASSEHSSAASTRSASVSLLFFGSYHTILAQSVEVEVGSRAIFVTVDSGGWFWPSLDPSGRPVDR